MISHGVVSQQFVLQTRKAAATATAAAAAAASPAATAGAASASATASATAASGTPEAASAVMSRKTPSTSSPSMLSSALCFAPSAPPDIPWSGWLCCSRTHSCDTLLLLLLLLLLTAAARWQEGSGGSRQEQGMQRAPAVDALIRGCGAHVGGHVGCRSSADGCVWGMSWC